MKRDSHELIYVIAGKEESLVGRQCGELLDKLLEPSQRATALLDAEGDSVSASDVLDELRTAPFLTDKRVVLIRKADDFVSKNRPLLEKYFDQPCPTGRLVLTVNSWDSRTKLAKKLPNVGKLFSIAEPKRWELPQRLIQYARDAYDKRLSRDAAELLVELSGDELTRLYSEVDKLALFADTEKVITDKHIESLVGHNRLFNAFSVIDAMIAGQAGAAVERLRGMFADDKSAEYTVVGAFAFHFRRLFNAKAMLEKGHHRGDVEKKLRIWGNKDGFFAQLRGMSLKQIGACLQHLAETDYAIKTGRTKAPVAMEQFVLRITLK
ncbi:MAG: DNA polymerase III subunit delta [Sedimentisphaerales bacterium]|nr:DNA polymerase III subunit delta [Sedimentisphaerales bacterium]